MLKPVAAFSFVVLSTTLHEVFAQTAAPAPGTPGAAAPAWMQFVPFMGLIAVFYFFLIRPQAKKQKEQNNFLSTLKSGDQIITQSGLLGKITGLNDQIVNLEIAPGVQIKIMKNQVLASQNTLQVTK